MSKCVVACSGGPDSMALLDQLNKQGKDIVVAHVNYKHRDTADRDEKIVKEYCKKYDIPVRRAFRWASEQQSCSAEASMIVRIPAPWLTKEIIFVCTVFLSFTL